MRKINFIQIFVLLFVSSILIPLTSAQEGNYRIQPEDVIQITVYEHDDLKTRARVSSTGEISFPLLDKVKVAGLTVPEIEKKLKVELEKDYLVRAQVQIFIEQYHLKQVTVLGAVTNPGKYDMHQEKETTVLEVIALAGGFTKVANVDGTKIIRRQGVNQMSIPIRVTDITKKGRKERDASLVAGDIIFVPESFF